MFTDCDKQYMLPEFLLEEELLAAQLNYTVSYHLQRTKIGKGLSEINLCLKDFSVFGLKCGEAESPSKPPS